LEILNIIYNCKFIPNLEKYFPFTVRSSGDALLEVPKIHSLIAIKEDRGVQTIFLN